jgi:hypothetical protein
MIAFHGNPQLKTRLEERAKMIGTQFTSGLAALREGQYAWQVRKRIMPLIPPVEEARQQKDDDKARAAAHENFGADLGIPARVAFVYTGLFEDMHESTSPYWPLRFARCIQVGSDMATVWRDFALYVLADPKVGLALYTQTGEQARAVQAIIELFENDAQDAEVWLAAARAAMKASHTSPNRTDGHGHNASECLESVGCSAAHAAAQFAYAFGDARYAQEAVMWAGWPLRHLAEYNHYARGERYAPKVDERNNVVVGDALWCMMMNRRDLDRASQQGEQDRHARYELFANKLVELIKKTAPRKPSFFRRWLDGRFMPVH